jgi:hypothetical protein
LRQQRAVPDPRRCVSSSAISFASGWRTASDESDSARGLSLRRDAVDRRRTPAARAVFARVRILVRAESPAVLKCDHSCALGTFDSWAGGGFRARFFACRLRFLLCLWLSCFRHATSSETHRAERGTNRGDTDAATRTGTCSSHRALVFLPNRRLTGP